MASLTFDVSTTPLTGIALSVGVSFEYELIARHFGDVLQCGEGLAEVIEHAEAEHEIELSDFIGG